MGLSPATGLPKSGLNEGMQWCERLFEIVLTSNIYKGKVLNLEATNDSRFTLNERKVVIHTERSHMINRHSLWVEV
jgi:hypothetical protein